MVLSSTRYLTLSCIAAVFVLSLGSPVSAGDFDGDGFMDLVVGSPGEEITGFVDAGAVNTLYGTADGLDNTGQEFFHQHSPGLDETAEATDLFGNSLAVGDFNGDGFYDLAVGAPSEDVGTFTNAGAVSIIYGTATGLVSTDGQLWTQDNCVTASSSENGDYFGAALASGDFDNDGYDDLAIGSPFEDINAENAAGAVVVLYGSPTGLTGSGDWWIGDMVDATTDPGDHFGWALAVGDFDADGNDDLAIGAPGDTISGHSDAGSTVIVHGHSTGLVNRAGNQLYHQDAGLPGACGDDDEFGNALATGDFDRDGYDDLVIGVHKESVDATDNAGMVHVLYGGAAGISPVGSPVFHQSNMVGDSSAVGENDLFGESLTCGDFNGDGYSDIAVGVPYEDWNDVSSSGMVNILWGSTTGITGAAGWLSEDEVVAGDAEVGNHFGFALAAGDFNSDGRDDLAIGTPHKDLNGYVATGTVYVVYGAATGLHGDDSAYYDQCSTCIGVCEDDDEFGKALASIPGGGTIFSDDFESNDLDRWSSVMD